MGRMSADESSTASHEVTQLRQRASTLQAEIATQTARRIANEELFRRIIESIHDYAIFFLDPSGHVATWNAGAERIKGYTADEIIGEHFSRFYSAEEVQAGVCDRKLEAAEREGHVEDEGWRVRKDGTRFWATVVITAVRDADGELLGFAKVTRDLTDKKRADDERLVAEERFRLLIGSVRDYAIFMLDPGGFVATWNPGAEQVKGYTPDEIIGRHFSVFYPDDAIRTGKCELELTVAAAEGRFEDEGWRVRKDGTRFWANVVISAIRDKHDQLIGFSKVTRDLTDRRRSEDERAARLAAEQANRAKDEFLAMLGHELRNPLAPIVTALQLMKLRGEAKSSREQQVIERQVRHMIHLVDDLLDISRITRGKIELKRQRLDVRAIVARAIEIASPLLEQRQHHFDVETPDREIMIEGDEARLTQVLSNILTNAAKYTEPGGNITVEVSTVGREVAIAVRDDGIGVEPALLPKLFDLFVQGRQGSDRSSGGLGIGLTLVRTLTQLHGGVVDAKSPGLGKGSTFTVRLPLAHGDLEETPTQPLLMPVAAKQPAVTPRRVLIVDDNVDALELLAEALAAAGHEVEVAQDPAAALELAQTFNPEVAILDIGLPVMDGYELAARMRKQLGGKPAPRMVALTGYGQVHDRVRAADAGFDQHFVKPVEIRRLLETIAAK